MPVIITPIGPDGLAEYANVPMVIGVRSRLILDDLERRLPTRPNPSLREEPIAIPYRKDYDALDGGPLQWPTRFDLSGWSFWLARDAGQTVGGAAMATRTPRLLPAAASADAILWDLRVHPAHRRKRIATALFHEAAQWAQSNGYTGLIIETQDVNVPANRFYAKMNCRVSDIDRHAYRSTLAIAHEVMLLWQVRW